MPSRSGSSARRGYCCCTPGEAISTASAERILLRSSRTGRGGQIALGVLIEQRYAQPVFVDFDLNRLRGRHASQPRAAPCCTSPSSGCQVWPVCACVVLSIWNPRRSEKWWGPPSQTGGLLPKLGKHPCVLPHRPDVWLTSKVTAVSSLLAGPSECLEVFDVLCPGGRTSYPSFLPQDLRFPD